MLKMLLQSISVAMQPVVVSEFCIHPKPASVSDEASDVPGIRAAKKERMCS